MVDFPESEQKVITIRGNIYKEQITNRLVAFVTSMKINTGTPQNQDTQSYVLSTLLYTPGCWWTANVGIS